MTETADSLDAIVVSMDGISKYIESNTDLSAETIELANTLAGVQKGYNQTSVPGKMTFMAIGEIANMIYGAKGKSVARDTVDAGVDLQELSNETQVEINKNTSLYEFALEYGTNLNDQLSEVERLLGENSFIPGDSGLTISVNGGYRSFKTSYYQTEEGMLALNAELSDLKDWHQYNERLSKGKFSDKVVIERTPPAALEDMKNNPDKYKNKGKTALLMEKAIGGIVIPYFEASAQYAKTIEGLSTVAETSASVKPKRAGRKKPNVNIEDTDFSEAKNELNKDCTIKE